MGMARSPGAAGRSGRAALLPRALRTGARVALVAPAGPLGAGRIERSRARCEELGARAGGCFRPPRPRHRFLGGHGRRAARGPPGRLRRPVDRCGLGAAAGATAPSASWTASIWPVSATRRFPSSASVTTRPCTRATPSWAWSPSTVPHPGADFPPETAEAFRRGPLPPDRRWRAPGPRERSGPAHARGRTGRGPADRGQPGRAGVALRNRARAAGRGADPVPRGRGGAGLPVGSHAPPARAERDAARGRGGGVRPLHGGAGRGSPPSCRRAARDGRAAPGTGGGRPPLRPRGAQLDAAPWACARRSTGTRRPSRSRSRPSWAERPRDRAPRCHLLLRAHDAQHVLASKLAQLRVAPTPPGQCGCARAIRSPHRLLHCPAPRPRAVCAATAPPMRGRLGTRRGPRPPRWRAPARDCL